MIVLYHHLSLKQRATRAVVQWWCSIARTRLVGKPLGLAGKTPTWQPSRMSYLHCTNHHPPPRLEPVLFGMKKRRGNKKTALLLNWTEAGTFFAAGQRRQHPIICFGVAEPVVRTAIGRVDAVVTISGSSNQPGRGNEPHARCTRTYILFPLAILSLGRRGGGDCLWHFSFVVIAFSRPQQQQ